VVNAVCGSGLEAVILAGRAIIAQEADLLIAGGAESATHSPYVVPRHNPDSAEKVDTILQDGLLCAWTNKTMGVLCEEIARKNNISRPAQDEFALRSHQKACAARETGKFDAETVAVNSPSHSLARDERPRANLTMARLADLPASFVEGGMITPGNSCAPADGACALLLASAKAVKQYGVNPLAQIIGYVHLAVEPAELFTGGVDAIKAVMRKCNWAMKDVDFFEITESFAAAVVYTQETLRIPAAKVNVWGGDVALGHPLGAAGSRALVTLLHALTDQKKKRGIMCTCFGGGGAIALAVENLIK